jgi:hypothetical protein
MQEQASGHGVGHRFAVKWFILTTALQLYRFAQLNGCLPLTALDHDSYTNCGYFLGEEDGISSLLAVSVLSVGFLVPNPVKLSWLLFS